MANFRQILDTPERIYAVGDIHGCSRELSVMLNHLLVKEKLGPKDLLVFIGDYIDRGPDSQGVIGQLAALKREDLNTVFLRGNHEDMLLDYLGFDGSMGEVYLVNGGREFMASYEITPGSTLTDILTAIPAEHLSFLRNLDSYVAAGDYIFAHAGLDPLKEIDMQEESDIFWIRDSFIANVHHFGKTVIFGHTPYHEVMFDLPYKVGIDTGLVYGNKLSCLEFTSKSIFQVEYGENKVKTRKFPV